MVEDMVYWGSMVVVSFVSDKYSSTFEFAILLQIFPVFSKQVFCISVPFLPLSPYVPFEFF